MRNAKCEIVGAIHESPEYTNTKNIVGAIHESPEYTNTKKELRE